MQLYYQIALSGLRDMDFAPEPRAGFEMTLLRMLTFQPVNTTERPVNATGASVETATAPVEEASAPVEPAIKQVPSVEPQPVNHVNTANSPPAPVPSSEPVAEPVRTASLAPQTAPDEGNTQQGSEPAASDVQQASREVLEEAVGAASSSSGIQPPAGPQGSIDWPTFSAGLPLKGMLVALAENIAVLEQSEQQLVLGISEAMASVCPEGVRQRLVELVMQHLPGREVRLDFITEGDVASQATPAAKAAKAEEDRQSAAEHSIQKDPNVQQLVSEFNGQVEPGSVKPVEL